MSVNLSECPLPYPKFRYLIHKSKKTGFGATPCPRHRGLLPWSGLTPAGAVIRKPVTLSESSSHGSECPFPYPKVRCLIHKSENFGVWGRTVPEPSRSASVTRSDASWCGYPKARYLIRKLLIRGHSNKLMDIRIS